MKKILSIICLSILMGCASHDDLAVPIEEMENYGPYTVVTEEAILAPKMVAEFKDMDEPKDYTFTGRLTSVCAKAGCWISVADGTGGEFRVRFKDHFTVPTDTELDQEAYIHGTAYWIEESVEDLKEQALEEGKSKTEIDAIVKPSYYFSFLADGVKLKKPKDD